MSPHNFFLFSFSISNLPFSTFVDLVSASTACLKATDHTHLLTLHLPYLRSRSLSATMAAAVARPTAAATATPATVNVPLRGTPPARLGLLCS